MKYISVTASAIILTMFSCTKEPMVDKYVTLSYKQTYCSDPWINLPVDSLTLKNVAAYIIASNLYIAGLSIKQETAPEVCTACTCKTGKTIYVNTFDDDILKEKYFRIGFK